MARKVSAVAHGVSTTMPVFGMRAGGGIVVDADGNSLIDLGSGIAVTTVGNSAPRVVDAVKAQVEEFTHTCFMVTPYESYVAVAEALNRLTPGDHEKRTALFNSGAEAVENAIKIARAHTGKQAVAAFDHAYHGRTNLTMALTAKNMPYKHGFGPFAPEVYRLPMSYPFRDAEFDILYGEGISREGDVLDLAVLHNIVDKSGAWYSYQGERIGQLVIGLQSDQRTDHQGVAPGGVGGREPQRLGEAERRLGAAAPGLVLPGELEPEVGVFRRDLQLGHQQGLVALALPRQALRRVAVVAEA